MAIDAASTVQRRVSLPSGLKGQEQAAELLVHALAQLPDSVVLDLPPDLPKRKSLELLAASYGIAARIFFERAPNAAPTGPYERLLREGRSLGEIVEALTEPGDPPASTRVDDEVFAGQRIAVITNVPTHYRVPLFATIAGRLAHAGCALRIFFLAPPPSTRSWMKPGEMAFDHEFLRGVDLSRDRGRQVLPLALERRLTAFSPTLILSGGFSPVVSGRAAFYARRTSVPFGIWSGELATRRTAQSMLRTAQRRWIIDRATFAIAYGSRSAQYLRSLRPDLAIVLGRNTTLAPPPRAKVDRGDVTEALTVGRAEAGKALGVAIEAVQRVPRCRLTVVGSGSQLVKLKRSANGNRQIRFVGAMPPDEVRGTYGQADVFLFPSRYDIFGLSLVEAMSAGLAPIVSARPGAVDDLCVSEANSLVIDGSDPAEWAAALSRLAEDEELRDVLGSAAQRTIRRRWTIEHAADAMLAGFRLGILGNVRGEPPR